MSWVDQLDVKLHQTRIAADQNNGNGLFATEDVAEDTVLVETPLSSLIATPSTGSSVQEIVDLAHTLQDLATNTKWSQYIALLPTEPINPLGWDADKIQQELDGSSIARAVEGIRAAVPQDLALPAQWVMSRALELPTPIPQRAIVPGIDMANHSDSPNARYALSANGESVQLLSTTNIASNTEICISYGDRDMNEYLFNYGFIPKHKRRISVPLDDLHYYPLDLLQDEPAGLRLKFAYYTAKHGTPTVTYDSSGWHSDFLLLLAVGELDGLDIVEDTAAQAADPDPEAEHLQLLLQGRIVDLTDPDFAAFRVRATPIAKAIAEIYLNSANNRSLSVLTGAERDLIQEVFS
ncbi:hypothetical protein CANCADRAFT_1321 [Tortispora caseinolytica NRRL Y-17796]|uniref:SET domain-containing protein n=1 Tax=Tortispora caseinolytica NRRL Y-17796 TaxID=767744 RepID=A0A1E4TLT6_9ASCO|nr:hypothetical protein CANCADRAFT_1321 [Tortispora caseinolytica NRRL Y-17796]